MRVSVRALTVVYRAPGGGDLPALGPLTFNIESGSFVSLVGPSGCGKSTLIRLLAGLQPATRGAALLGDTPVDGPSPQVGLMFQDANLLPWRTIHENMALPLELAGVPRSERDRAITEMLPGLGLADFANAYPAELSGGMAQRVALGRVLLQEPAVLLLDEPFGALDAMTREQISLDLLRIWRSRHQTILMVTHDINEAILLSDRVLVLSPRPGQLVADVPVMLDRPREIQQMYDRHFAELVQRVRTAIAAV